MASDKKWVLSRIPNGTGFLLDVGGGTGALGAGASKRGYRYVNADLSPSGEGLRVRADAHALPFRSESFSIVASSDSLEHFVEPRLALAEIRRVLNPEGRLALWVPFMHPFHGDDFFRFSPLGLRTLLADAGFEILDFESPLWIFSIFAQALSELLRRLRLNFLQSLVNWAAAGLDRLFLRFHRAEAAFAQFFLVSARPCR